MFFAMPMALFPALAESYGGGAVVGLLYAAPSAGAVLFLAVSGWTARVHHHGRRSCSPRAAGAWRSPPSAWRRRFPRRSLCLAVAGGADAISGVFRATIWNETIPDRLRGRLAGVEMISWSSGPLLGNAEAGADGGAGGGARVGRGGRRAVRGGLRRPDRGAAAAVGLRLPPRR